MYYQLKQLRARMKGWIFISCLLVVSGLYLGIWGDSQWSHWVSFLLSLVCNAIALYYKQKIVEQDVLSEIKPIKQ